MALLQPLDPCYTAIRFRPLLQQLLAVLRGLTAADWDRQTVARRWRVRDVAAHLLDGDLRKIAVYRDSHSLTPDPPLAGEAGLTAFINDLNASGVSYAARLSPRLITDLLATTGSWVADLIEDLPPHGRSIFPVSWAGEAESENWMDTGREYTERWHHQMQIRAAVGAPLLLQPEWMAALLDLSVRALPHAYRSLVAPDGTAIVVQVAGETNATWTLLRHEQRWQIFGGESSDARTRVRMTTDDAWRLFYNALPDVSRIAIEGDRELAAPLLRTRSVIV